MHVKFRGEEITECKYERTKPFLSPRECRKRNPMFIKIIIMLPKGEPWVTPTWEGRRISFGELESLKAQSLEMIDSV